MMGITKKRILVVEDEPGVRDFVQRGLEHFGYDVETAVNGFDGLEKFRNFTYDMVITDIVMPGMDGISFALQASKHDEEVPILLMTGYAQEKFRAHNLGALIFDVLEKPFSLQYLVERVKGALAEKRVKSPYKV